MKVKYIKNILEKINSLYTNFKSLFRSKNQLLTQHIERERDKLYRSNTKGFLKRLVYKIKPWTRVSEVYIPSCKSTVFILSPLFIAIFIQPLVWLCPDVEKYLQKLFQNHCENIIKIHEGIGVIIFALVIFVAESLRDDEATDKARVLLRESCIFPIAVAVIFVFIIFLCIYIFSGDDVNRYSILLFSAIIIYIVMISMAAITSLYKIISVLLRKTRFVEQRAKLLRERLGESIDLAIDERIGDNILLSKLNTKDIKLCYYNHFPTNDGTKYHTFQAKKFGIVSDIDLDKLEELANIVDKEGKKNCFSFSESKDIPVMNDVNNDGKVKSKSLKNNKRYLLKKFHDVVDEERSDLIFLDKKLIEKSSNSFKEISNLVNSAFIIKPNKNFTEEVRREISGLKDQFISAIENKQQGKVEELASIYIKLAEEFLEQITKFGSGYSAEQARIERSSPFAGWCQVEWLSYDIGKILGRAMQSRDLEIINSVANLPFAIVRRAIKKQDHYLFQEFILFSVLIYRVAIKEKSDDLKKLVNLLLSYGLKDICYSYVEAKLEKDIPNSKCLIDFGIYFFAICQNLMKEAFDNKDTASFETFKETSIKLFCYFKPNESKKKIKHDIDTKRKQMFFGLASWIFGDFKSNKTDEVVKKFYNSIKSDLPSKIEDFTNIFWEVRSYEVMSFWGWEGWEIRSRGEEKCIKHDFKKLEMFYIVKSLTLLENKNDEECKKIKLPLNTNLAIIEENLISVLNDIKTKPSDWEFVLNKKAFDKVDILKELLVKAKEEQEKDKTKRKREQNISEKRVQEFKEEMLKAFYENANMRHIFTKYLRAYENRTKEETDKGGWIKINQADDKAVFFDEWHVSYTVWGKEYGCTLASIENSYLLDAIAKNCKEITKDDFETALAKIKNPVIFATSIAFVDFLNDIIHKANSEHIKERLEVEGFSGWYKFNGQLIPIFEMGCPEKEQILILDKSKIGKLVQLSPLSEGEKKEAIEDIFYIDIQAFSEDTELMEKCIKESPEWLKKDRNEQEQREYLQECVYIQIFERLEYNNPADFEGYKLY